MAFYTYILLCRDGSYYVGHTDDIERRMAEHQTGALGGYTARRLPVTLLWAESFQTRDDAFAAEHKLRLSGVGEWLKVRFPRRLLPDQREKDAPKAIETLDLFELVRAVHCDKNDGFHPALPST